MKKPALSTYERQLDPAALDRFHRLLLQPGLTRAQVQAKIPAWCSGRYEGRQPSLETLDHIAARLNTERSVGEIRVTEQVVSDIQTGCGHSDLGRLPGPLLDAICSLLGQQILERVSNRTPRVEDNEKLRIMLKREDQRLARARFMRETCHQFLNWFKNEQARQIARSRDSNAEKIERLGKLIYGEHW